MKENWNNVAILLAKGRAQEIDLHVPLSIGWSIVYTHWRMQVESPPPKQRDTWRNSIFTYFSSVYYCVYDHFYLENEKWVIEWIDIFSCIKLFSTTVSTLDMDLCSVHLYLKGCNMFILIISADLSKACRMILNKKFGKQSFPALKLTIFLWRPRIVEVGIMILTRPVTRRWPWAMSC